MASGRTSEIIRRLGRAAFLREWAGLTDGQLLDCFLRLRQGAAVEVLVRRHGPMVWGVCRRVLRNHHDAEDAFQATFLVHLRKAASISPRDLLANWLYGVARQTAMKARAVAAKRAKREMRASTKLEPAAPMRNLGDDLPAILDLELSRLPQKYRAVLLLCDLEGRTRREAAEQLGVPEGTVASRHSRARAMLAKRLAGLGVCPSAGLAGPLAPAPVPRMLVLSTACSGTFGRTTASVAALAEGVMKAMQFTKLCATGAILGIVTLIAGGTALVAGQACRPALTAPALPRATGAAAGDAADKDAPKPDRAQDDETAWGEAVGGIQAGIAFAAGGRHVNHVGDDVTFVVKVRNVGPAATTVSYLSPPFLDLPPSVEDAASQTVPVRMPLPKGYKRRTISQTLAAGEEIELGRPELAIASADPGDDPEKPTLVAAAGTYQIRYAGVVRLPAPPGAAGLVSTGKAALDVAAQDKEEEAAWGKRAGGLQAGLAIKGGRHAFRIGDVVPLVVRLRNVSEKGLAFDYTDGFFVENPPAVTDAAGKTARMSAFPIFDGLWRRLHQSLAPGQAVEFGSLDLVLAPADAKDGAGRPTLFVAPGVYRVQYETLPPLWASDPSKAQVLSTGRVELEVRVADSPDQGKGDLEGTWQAVSFEQDGRTPRGVEVKEVAATFRGDDYQFTTGLRAQGMGKGKLAVHPDTDPKTFELTPDSGVFKGQACRGIYKREGDRLTLCFSWPVKDRPSEFASPPDSTVILAVFERRKP